MIQQQQEPWIERLQARLIQPSFDGTDSVLDQAPPEVALHGLHQLWQRLYERTQRPFQLFIGITVVLWLVSCAITPAPLFFFVIALSTVLFVRKQLQRELAQCGYLIWRTAQRARSIACLPHLLKVAALPGLTAGQTELQSALVPLLIRLTPTEAAALEEPDRALLRGYLQRYLDKKTNRTDLITAILFALSAAHDKPTIPLASSLALRAPSDQVREAAAELLLSLGLTPLTPLSPPTE